LDLKDFLQAYPEVQIATRADNEALLDFFSRTALRGRGLGLNYDRSPDFFAFLELHSPESLVLIYRSPGKGIQGVATFVFRWGYVAGRPAKVCYLGDLRIGPDRGASRMWRGLYGRFFTHRREITEFKEVQKFYTVLMNDNPLSQRSLVRNKKSGYAYNPVCPYSMITLLAPKFPRRKNSFPAKPAGSLPELQAFYEAHEDATATGYLYGRELPQRLQHWPDLDLGRFWTVSQGGSVIASCAFWSPQACKKIRLERTPWYLKFFLGFEKELKVVYITHLLFAKGLSATAREEAFASLLRKAWELRGQTGSHFVSFCDFHRASLKKAAAGFFRQEVGMSVFEVSSSADPAPPGTDTYGFEMALV
jgi:hypothetical protein